MKRWWRERWEWLKDYWIDLQWRYRVYRRKQGKRRIKPNYRRCAHCGKRHWLFVPIRYWWHYLTHHGLERLRMPLAEPLFVVNAATGEPLASDPKRRRQSYKIITNYHRTGWGIYCHNCWPIYLRQAEHDYGDRYDR